MTLVIVGSIEMGIKLFMFFLSPYLKSAATFDVFHILGVTPSLRQQLIRYVIKIQI